jgi:hypothetical protein
MMHMFMIFVFPRVDITLLMLGMQHVLNFLSLIVVYAITLQNGSVLIVDPTIRKNYLTFIMLLLAMLSNTSLGS